jgi:tRNA(adenine34) deaminase
MNTTLGTGDQALSAGFLGWKDMCAKNPGFDIARLMERGDPAMSPNECAAYMAPFPDATYRAATRAFPPMVPDHPDADGADVSRKARDFWRNRWNGKTLMAVGMRDPVLGLAVMEALQRDIRNCPEPLRIAEGGHFVQERAGSVAHTAVELF